MRSLYALSNQVKSHTLDVCRDPGQWFWIVVDNCQNFLRRRVFRVGRDNHMNIGMAGTVWVAPLSTTDPSKIFDYEDKERRRAQCQRDHLTTERLLRFVDANHERKVFAFQWLWVLGNYIEPLRELKSCANTLLRTEGRIRAMPSTAQFERFSYELHDRYTTEEAIYRVSNGLTNGNVFEGSSWESPSPESSPTSGPATSKILAFLDASRSDEDTFSGDLVLARSQDLIREAIRSREALWSSAEGDVGRVWAQLKAMMFAFAGSSHKKYAQYLLETLIDFELESSPQLREALLSTGVANISGRPGGYKPTDLLQEYSQRMLEAVVQHKGAEFGERFIREGIARNLAHFQRLKEEFLGGVGLERHSQRRSKPSVDTEMRILLKEYRESELHSFRKGRRFGEVSSHETQFDTGVRNLNSGLLKKWTTRMVLLRDSNQQSASTPPHVPSSPLAAESQDDEADIIDTLDIPLYSNTSNDGDISSQLLDPVLDARLAIDMMEVINGDSSDEETFDLVSQLEQTQGDGFDTDEDDTWVI